MFSTNLNAASYFSLTIFRSLLRDFKSLAVTLLTPMFMLGMFAFMGRVTGTGTGMYAATVGFALMMVGSVQATRIVTWRETGVFRRLAATPTSLGALVVGASGAQIMMAFLQGLLIAILGAIAFGISLTAFGVLWGLLAIVLGAAVFIALGSLVGSLSPKAEIANLIYIFSQLPLFFLGGGLPAEILPESVQKFAPYLPNTMLHEFLQAVMVDNILPENWYVMLLSLIAYALLLSVGAALLFRRTER